MSQFLVNKILSQVRPGDRVLDVGAGLESCYSDALVDRAGSVTLFDAHAPYLTARPEHPKHIRIVGEAPQDLRPLPVRAFDVVLACDFIEHLEKPVALEVLSELRRVTDRTICIFTPEGFHPQTQDAWKMGGERWQTHRSAWESEDFIKLGFVVERWPDFHQIPGLPSAALWAIWRRW